MRIFLSALLLVGLVAGVTMPVVAQSANNSTVSSTATAPNGTYVTSDLELIEAGYDDRTGEAWVELRSTEPMAVTVSDGGALSEGSGEIESRTVALDANETTRVNLPVTKSSGKVAVIISADGALYGHVIKPSNALFREPFTARDAQITAAAGALVVAIVSSIMVLRYIRGTSTEPERIA